MFKSESEFKLPINGFKVGIFKAKKLRDWDKESPPVAVKLEKPLYLYKNLSSIFLKRGLPVSTADSLKSVEKNSNLEKEFIKELEKDKKLVRIIFGLTTEKKRRENFASAILKRSYAIIATPQRIRKNNFIRTGETLKAISAKIDEVNNVT